MEYIKLPKTIDEQISLLRSRGLVINDQESTAQYLKNISYYHLSSYFKFFQNSDDSFHEGRSFEDVLNIYVFDQKLRLLILDILERIEKSFKCRLVYEVSIQTKDPFWMTNEDMFDVNEYYERIQEMIANLKSSKEPCIKRYYQHYTSPEYPPAWTIVEALTFGQTVMIYHQLKSEHQSIVAQSYGINKRFIYSWMYALSIVRNICAHHSRIWNFEPVVRLDQGHGIYKNFFFNSNGNRLFNYLVVIHIFNCKFNPTSSWIDRLKEIIEEHHIEVSHMGFPLDWEERMLKISEMGKQELGI